MTTSLSLPSVALAVIAADFNSWRQLGDYFVREWPNLAAKFMAWGGLLSVLAAVWWTSAIYWRRRMAQTVNSPRRLFRELCRAHRLNWKEVALLHELGELRGADVPTSFFVREDEFAFDDAALDEKTRREAEALRAKLFTDAAAPTEHLAAAGELLVADEE